MNESIKNPFALEVKSIEKETALELQSAFMPFFEKADEWAKKAKEIVITSAEQKEDIALARDIRINLKSIRVNIDKKRKSLKEESLRKGKAIDGMANIVKYLIVPVEEYLQEQEDFVKQQEEKRKSDLAEKRIAELSQYEVETEYYNLVDMSEDGYKQLLQTSKMVFDQKREAEKKIEQEKIAKEKAIAEEQQRMRKENEALKKEAEERERVAKIEADKQAKAEVQRKAKEEKERAAYESKLKKEREEKVKIETELKRKREAEERTKQETEEKEREEKLASDKEKLERLAVTVQEIQMPSVTSKEAKNILTQVVELLNKTSNFIKQKSIDL